MKIVILAGGMGTRISEESQLKPKPMIEIGNRPILWHIMKWYSSFGFNEFIICCGYKGHMIKNYFIHYGSNVRCNLQDSSYELLGEVKEPWKVTLADTGLKTLTAGRLLQVQKYIEEDTFMLTYGDGVSDVDINKLLEFHKEKQKIATITTTQPAGRFGAIKIDHETGIIENFKEKAREDQAWVNAGFMVLNKRIFDYLGEGEDMLEALPFERLAADGEMTAYKHPGFWSPMDTMRDKEYLEKLWESGEAPWKTKI